MSTSKKGVLWFLALAFGLAWILWLAPILLAPVGSPLFAWLIQPGNFAPAAAAFIVRKWITKEGFADAGLGINYRRWPYFLFGWFLPPITIGIIVAEATLFPIGAPDFSLSKALHGLANGTLPTQLPSSFEPAAMLKLCLLAVVATPLLWGEEFGWRGYLQQRLCPGRSLYAAVITGLIWALWHLPWLLQGYLVFHKFGVLLYVVPAILFSVIFGWLMERTGSIWASSLAHSATDLVGAQLTMQWHYGAEGPMLVAYGGVLSWLPLGALSLWIILSGGLKSRHSPHEITRTFEHLA